MLLGMEIQQIRESLLEVMHFFWISRYEAKTKRYRD